MAKTSTAALRARWKDPAFVAANQALVDQIFLAKSFDGQADLRGIGTGVGIHESPPLPPFPEIMDGSIAGVDFGCANLSMNLDGGDFRRCSFASARLDTTRFSGARFTECDFRDAELFKPWLQESTFTDCSFAGARIGRRARISDENGGRATFVRCDFTGATVRAVKLKGARFVDCRFDGAVIRECYVLNWKFEGGTPPRVGQFLNCEYLGLNVGIVE